jgi:hypothetical protein
MTKISASLTIEAARSIMPVQSSMTNLRLVCDFDGLKYCMAECHFLTIKKKRPAKFARPVLK